MVKRCAMAVVLGIMVTGLFAGGAQASVRVGSDCAADTSLIGGATFFNLVNATESLPSAAPSSGVVTSWSVRSDLPSSEPLSEKLKVFRPTSDPQEFTAVGDSSRQSIAPGTNSFSTSIPVRAGDLFGVFGDIAYCATENSDDTVGQSFSELPVNSTGPFSEGGSVFAAVSVVIEPDADGDGLGDETQDRCSRSASVKMECPPLTLSSYGQASKNSAIVLLATGSHSVSPVSVSAEIQVPKSGKKRKAKTLQLIAPTQSVGPGQLGRFTLPFSVPLSPPSPPFRRKKFLSMTITARGTDAVGVPGTSVTTLRLKGQAKAKPKKK